MNNASLTYIIVELVSYPTATLYAVLALVCAAVAILSFKPGHRLVAMCYAISALTHAMLCWCEVLHLG